MSALTAVGLLAAYAGAGSQVSSSVERQSVTWVSAAQEVPAFSVRVKRDMGFVAAGAALVAVHGEVFDRTLGRCTIGAPWRTSDGRLGYVTAGHCAEVGDDVTVLSGENFARVGSVTTSVSPHVVDAAFVEADKETVFAPALVVRGDGASTQLLRKRDVPITGFADAVVGDKVCAVGTSSGTTCDWTVVDVDKKMSIKSQVYRGVFATGFGDQCIQKGDSGGPVFILEDGQATLVGLVSALANHQAGDAVDARYRCGMLIAPISKVRQALSGRPLLAGDVSAAHR